MSGYVLDTHAWLWLTIDDPEFDPKARELLGRAGGRNELFVAAISVWELGMLEAKGRIVLARPIEDWVRGALAIRGLRLAPLTPEIALACVHLPGDCPPDPADRMIVATARALGAGLATRDRRIIDYGNRGHVRCLAV